ncbi:MAG: SIS domain-containing protein [Candidatus Eisenbacteria bacterium]
MNEFAERATGILRSQIRGLEQLEGLFPREVFGEAVRRIRDCRGRLLVTGVGKSGIVASKIAASFRSTATPALYIHPVDAMHGDVGLLMPDDLGLFVSKSGESRELLDLVPSFQRMGVSIVSIVCRPDSSLARLSTVVLDVGPIEEPGPIPEVPTTSTTVFQALGDVLTLLVLWEKGLTREHFAFLHPGGVLGRIATLRVRDAMKRGSDVPRVPAGATLREALVEMIEKRLGMTTVVDSRGALIGVLTDGDIRRILFRYGSIDRLEVRRVMTPEPKTIDPDELLAGAVARMETNPGGPITSLIVVDEQGKPSGVLHLHDCLRLGTGPAPSLA